MERGAVPAALPGFAESGVQSAAGELPAGEPGPSDGGCPGGSDRLGGPGPADQPGAAGSGGGGNGDKERERTANLQESAELDDGLIGTDDAGRGGRRYVASPKPQQIVELGAIRALSDSGNIVICCGGGGIPVYRTEHNHLKGAAAVIDKDFASELLAEQLDADMLIILTAVEKVAINFNKPDQKGLDDLTPAEARKYMEENQFAKGSMLPKVQAAVKFAESKAGRTALITLLEKAKDGIEGKTGTRVHQ